MSTASKVVQPGREGLTDDDTLACYRVMLVDDDHKVTVSLSRVLRANHFEVTAQNDPTEALTQLTGGRDDYDVVVCDVSMPQMNGLDLLDQVVAAPGMPPVIMLTGDASAQTAVRALKSGAYDYLTKPLLDIDSVLVCIRRAAKHGQLQRRAAHLERRLQRVGSFQKIVARSASMRQLFNDIDKLAKSDVNVLILGESGTGKELVAHAIHDRSARTNHPFFGLNCAAMPDTLVDSELFGHTRGAFTGAVSAHPGAFESANRGSLFLDEIGDISSSVQVRLLRVLQEREVRPLGADAAIPVDVRVLAATHVDLDAAVADRRFREDLFYRLNVVSLVIPPLRERIDDVPLLAAHFMHKHGSKRERPLPKIDEELMDALMGYSWPGNVRELENVIQRGLALCDGGALTMAELPPSILNEDSHMPAAAISAQSEDWADGLGFAEARKLAQHRFESRYLERLLRLTNGNISRAARLAGMDRSNFRRVLVRHEFDVNTLR